MVKTNVPSEFKFGNNTIATNALPDPFDALDLQYRPKLQMLPPVLDGRAGKVLDQKGQSCTGHAVAALIDTVNSLAARKRAAERPAPTISTIKRQLPVHALRAGPASTTSSPATPTSGRRFAARSRAGTTTGSARRGPGATPRPPNPTSTTSEFIAECMKTPLGAYYRVNARRLDDMQSAMTELNAIAASAAIHEGWRKPCARCTPARPMWVTADPEGREPDAAGRPRVPASPATTTSASSSRTRGARRGAATATRRCPTTTGWTTRTTRGSPGPAFRRSASYPAAQGDRRAGGGFVVGGRHGPGPAQVVRGQRDGGRPDGHEGQGDERPGPDRGARREDGGRHRRPGRRPRRAATSDGSCCTPMAGSSARTLGIEIADRMINWWRQNYIYPVHLVWESDAVDDDPRLPRAQARRTCPFGGLLDGGCEQLDTLLEIAGRSIQHAVEGDEGKRPPRVGAAGRSRSTSHGARRDGVHQAPEGVSRRATPTSRSTSSATARARSSWPRVVERLAAENIPVESLQLMGGAISIDEFLGGVASRLVGIPGSAAAWSGGSPPTTSRRRSSSTTSARARRTRRSTTSRCCISWPARSSPMFWEFEKPMVGLDRTISAKLKSNPSKSLLDLIGGQIEPGARPEQRARDPIRGRPPRVTGSSTTTRTTMTSVLLRILNQNVLTGTVPYRRGGWPSG